MASDRRGFIKAGALALFATGLGGIPRFITRAAAQGGLASGPKKPKVLVCIFQRGAMDGLMAVPPFTDQAFKEARPNLYMAADKSAPQPIIDLDGRFGMHPSMDAFEPLFREKRLAIVHGIGSPNTTRSHFDAQDYMESGTPFNKGTGTGWLSRAVELMGQHESDTPFKSISLTSSLPKAFYGDKPALAINNLQDFSIQLKNTPKAADLAAKTFESLYDQTTNSLLNKTGKESFEAMKSIQKIDMKGYKPANNARYPDSQLGNALKQIAQLIKLDVGLQVAFTECGGWDTHNGQMGQFGKIIGDLSGSIANFWKDIEPYQDEVTLMTMTEFGRTVKQNGTYGTDHGRGSCLFLLGNDVNGGIVHGNMPSLVKENLADGRDLPVTTDFRSVFSEVADTHLNIHNDKKLFPEWDGTKIGVMKQEA